MRRTSSDERSFAAAARQLLGPDSLVEGAAATEIYGTDWRGVYVREPLAVARPRSTQEVATLVRLCASHGVGVVPQGGNTGLCGGAVPASDRSEVVISLARLNKVRNIDALGGTITVEAGCVLQRVQEAAAEQGRLFPLRLGAEGSCQIGGCIATNAGGMNALRYGTARQLVLGLEVVLPDGRIWNGLRSLHKDNTGYDLKQLMIGSEGTLGIITAATLRLFPIPQRRSHCLAALASIEDALALLARLQAAFDAQVMSFELMDGEGLRAAERILPQMRRVLPLSHPWYVLVEVATASVQLDLDDMLAMEMADASVDGIIADGVLATTISQARDLWFWREAIVEAERRNGPSLKHDISAALTAIPALVRELKKVVPAISQGTRPVAFGHLGDGNIHFNVWLSKDCTGSQAAKISEQVYAIVGQLHGSVSAEHGIGQHKVDLLRQVKSPIELELMARVKSAIDPSGLMNPGKVLRREAGARGRMAG
jgi:FAD/FMN-containing dehydrogenase